MEYSDQATLIGSLGVALLLLAFLLNVFCLLRVQGYPYTVLNLVGASLACYSSYLIDFIPFVVLEGTWAVVAGVALVRSLLGLSGVSSHLKS
ncbi:MAG: CBU_0592 family membrane protein [Gammaproteobacteria bacterium]